MRKLSPGFSRQHHAGAQGRQLNLRAVGEPLADLRRSGLHCHRKRTPEKDIFLEAEWESDHGTTVYGRALSDLNKALSALDQLNHL